MSHPGMTIPAADPLRRPTAREIPYDYVATFNLTGMRGNRVQDVINISIEGTFVAVSVGYSYIPPKLPDAVLYLLGIKQPPEPPVEGPTINLRDTVTAVFHNATEALGDASKLQADGAAVLAKSKTALRDATEAQLKAKEALQRVASANALLAATQSLSQLINLNYPSQLGMVIASLLGGVARPINFFYSMVDSGTGRELQNQKVHNIAGLGTSTGERPFRVLPRPMVFLPRSTIRVEIEEISDGPLYEGGELQLVLHGYKVLQS